MTMRARSPAIMVLVATGMLAGCADYANRRDTIAPGAGNAMEANMAVHAANAFPPHRNVTAIRSDGRIAVRNVELYRGTTAAAGAAYPTATASSAPAAQPALK